jgi:hypothetical protein
MLNYKHFISFFLYDYAFEHLVVPGFKTEVTNLSIVKELKHIGYFLNKNTINKAIQSTDPVLGNTLFNYKLAFKGVLADEIIAMKLILNVQPDFIELIKKYNPDEDKNRI